MAVGDLSLSHRNLPLLLQQARERVIGRFRPLLTAQRLTEQQWRVLRLLLETGPLEPRQISQICNISSPSLAGVLARMENLGLITRQRFDNDQRRVSVTPTPRGRVLAERLAPQIEAAYATIEAHVGSEFTRRLYTMLDELIATLDGNGEEAPPAMQARD